MDRQSINFNELTGVDCGPPRLRNGKVTFNSTLFEANATYSCNTGYKLVGERVIQCLSNGVWSYTSRCDGGFGFAVIPLLQLYRASDPKSKLFCCTYPFCIGFGSGH